MIQTYETPPEWKEAQSFTESYPPNDAELAGIVHSKYGVDFIFYKDKDGGMWYESKRRKENNEKV